MSAILQELQEMRATVHRNQLHEPRIGEIEDLSIEFMEAARASIAILQSDRTKAEVWMSQYQAWADTTHRAMQYLLQESEDAGRRRMVEETVE